MNLFELYVKIGAEDKASPAMENVQKNSETLTNKIKVMSAQFESAQKNVDELTKKFNESVRKTGATSKETQELAKKLEDAEKEAKKAKKALDDYNSELEETEEKAENAGNSLSKFSNKLGNGLQTAAKVGAAAVGVAATGIVALTKSAVESFAEYEQLAGGAQKIFDQMDYSKIATDANNAYKELGMSANQYLAIINDVGATFAATMGDESGYEAAKTGLKAISDYASGTGKNVDELSQKFTLITRSTSSYQSIADQFSGILPATSDAFLQQAQAAGILSDSYTKLTEVPIAEYQSAVSQMLERGVKELGLADNTIKESTTTVSGSIAAMQASWSNLITGIADDNANLDVLLDNFIDSVETVVNNIVPVIGKALPRILEAGKGIIKSLLDGIASGEIDIADVTEWIITFIIDTIVELFPLLIEAGISIIAQLLVGILQAIPRLLRIGPDILNAIVESLFSVGEKIAKQGEKVVQWIKDGIASALQGLVDWFNNLWDSLFNRREVNVKVNTYENNRGYRRYKNGLDYVPYDGYVAELDRGERVLTAEESKQYNIGQKSYGDIYINVDGAKYTDPRELAEVIAEELQFLTDRKVAAYA